MAKLYVRKSDGTYVPQQSVLVSNLDIVQEKGDSLISAMSQKAVTDELATKQDTISDLETIRSNAQNASDAVTSMIEAGYVFAGVATPSTNPETPNAKVFYLANGKGTYTNFGGIEVIEDEVVVLYYDTAWHKEVTGIASQAKLTELERDLGQLQGKHIANIEFQTSAGVIFTENVPVKLFGGERVTINLEEKSFTRVTIYLMLGNTIVSTFGNIFDYQFPYDIDVPSNVDNIRFSSWNASYSLDGMTKGTIEQNGAVIDIQSDLEQAKSDIALNATNIAKNTQEINDVSKITENIAIPFFKRAAFIDLSSAVVGEIYTDRLEVTGSYIYAKIECHEGEIFLINTTGNTDKAMAYAILDHDNRVLVVERTAVNKEIVIPTGGVSLYVNSKKDARAYIKKKDNAIEDNKEGISELRTDVGISIGCEYGAINYLTGQYINDTNFCRTNQRISINANSIIKMQFPISVNKAYLVKYKDGVYAGYAEIGKIDATEYNYNIIYDDSYDSFELRFDAKLTSEQLSSVKIVFSQGVFINELGKAIATIKNDIEDLKGKQGDLYDKEYFVDRVNQYFDLNYNVGDYADLTKHEKFSGYGFVIVELYKGESVTANVSGGTPRARCISVIGRSGLILFNKTYTYNDTYTAIEDCLVIFNMRIADGYRIVAHKDKSKMYNQDIYTDVVFNTMLVKRLNLSGYRNIGEFGKIIIDELYSHYLALVPNHNLPHTKDYGFITTDADFVREFEDSNDEVKMMRAKSPCFYYDGKRKGCIVLFDEAGEAYIIDNTGNKKYLSFK